MLEINNVSYAYSRKAPKVLDGFSLSLAEGGVYGLLGPNGAGKSTLLNIIAGALTPATGSVKYDGVNTRLRLPDTMAEIFIVPEEFNLPAMTLLNYARRYGALYPRFSLERMLDHLKTFEITGNPRLDALSMGQKKKVFMSFANLQPLGRRHPEPPHIHRDKQPRHRQLSNPRNPLNRRSISHPPQHRQLRNRDKPRAPLRPRPPQARHPKLNVQRQKRQRAMKSPTFDTTRFSKYFTCYTATNSRRLWLYAAIILITWLLVCILPPVMTLFSSYSYDLPADPAWETEGTWAFLLLMLFTGLSGAMFYSSFNPRGARVQVLTAPASSFEKFLTWFIIYFFGMIAVFYASAFIADLIRVGVVKAFAACPSTARPISALEIFGLAIDKPFDQINAPDVLQWIGFYGLALSNFAIFALGSIVFYAKNAFIKTIGCLVALNAALSYIAFASFKVFFGNSSFEPRFDPEVTITSNCTLAAISIIVFAFLLWLGYRRFKEADIVNRW